MSLNLFAVPSLPDDVLQQLVATPLPYLRSARSVGRGRSIELADLHEDERTTVLRIYDILGSLDPIRTGEESRAGGRPAQHANDEGELGRLVRSLGNSRSKARSDDVLGVLHDVRSGASTALVSALELDPCLHSLHDLFATTLLARDQRKLMRSAILDLDPVASARDLAHHAHTTSLLVRGLMAMNRLHQGVRLAVDCRFDGAVSASCVELGALERVLYNLVNNARRHASRGRVGVWVLSVDSRFGKDVRIVVANFIHTEDEDRLRERFGASLDDLFLGEFSSTGSGIGLRTSASLVAEAFGLPSARAAVHGRYLGARVFDGSFVAWFHWPTLDHRSA